MSASENSPTLGVIGGAGHVGLPLAIAFANAGVPTHIYDINADAVASLLAGRMPFAEVDGEARLAEALASGRLTASDTPDALAGCDTIICVIGTPVDEHLNPSFTAMTRALDDCFDHLRDGQLLILRSTIFPGITRYTQDYLSSRDRRIDVAFCPERVAQGNSFHELRKLPQIVSAFNDDALDRATRLFSKVADTLIAMPVQEAELSKLMTNAWRYIQFATVNQFYMIATENGLDFDRILHACRHEYPRMAGTPGPGFAAGPCLIKDTMQLAAFDRSGFALGYAAMQINEGLPAHLVGLARRHVNLRDKTTGILGTAFKAASDDDRDSLSHKLRKLLTIESARVLCTDPYVNDDTLVPLQTVLEEADVVFLATPHPEYRGLEVPDGTLLIDVWNHAAPAGADA